MNNEEFAHAGLAIDVCILAVSASAVGCGVMGFVMTALGVGWNFLFLSGTNLLRYGYRDEERFKVQSVNDFLVFSIQAFASLSSGWFLFDWGWQGVISASVPLVIAFALMAFFLRHKQALKPG